MKEKGIIPPRQDAANLHGVIVDPTGNFILVRDLGADFIRIYSIDNSTGKLTPVEALWKMEGLVLTTMRSGLRALSTLQTNPRTLS
jgi:6-phosphogluconolactonase (cycloisomerase 2 family)